jgi:hypothetical protein
VTAGQPSERSQPLKQAALRLGVVRSEVAALLWQLRRSPTVLTDLAPSIVAGNLQDHLSDLDDIMGLIDDARFGPPEGHDYADALPF